MVVWWSAVSGATPLDDLARACPGVSLDGVAPAEVAASARGWTVSSVDVLHGRWIVVEPDCTATSAAWAAGYTGGYLLAPTEPIEVRRGGVVVPWAEVGPELRAQIEVAFAGGPPGGGFAAATTARFSLPAAVVDGVYRRAVDARLVARSAAGHRVYRTELASRPSIADAPWRYHSAREIVLVDPSGAVSSVAYWFGSAAEMEVVLDGSTLRIDADGVPWRTVDLGAR